MELLKLFANQNMFLGKLQRLLALPQREDVSVRPTRKRAQKRLTADDATQLLAAYESGIGVNELARRFQTHRTTVSNLLDRHGIVRRSRGLDPADVPEAARLYEDGWSLARLGQHFEVTGHNTISDALRKAGVTIRLRRGAS